MPDTVAPAPALQEFLRGLFDYAGLFPPAALAFDEAFTNYLVYRRRAHAWMLGRFVLPAARLPEMAAAAQRAAVEAPVALSCLATPASDPSEWLGELGDDLDAIAAAHAAHGEVVHVDALEMKLPPEAWQGDTPELWRSVAERAEAAGIPAMAFFGEVPLHDAVLDRLPALAGEVAAYNKSRPPMRGLFGLKLRLGGPTPEAHPPVQSTARAIAAFRDADIPFKATAGLHHPIRHHNERAATKMHGFINLFGAAALARHRDLDTDAIASILAEKDASAFRFGARGFAWRDLHVPLDDLVDARNRFALSIGSCSFDEPVDDLRSLGLL